MSTFEKLSSINVNKYTEKKNGLTYLSWSWAWSEFCKVYPDATYKVFKNEQGLPYVYDQNTGYMCFVEVTAGGMTHEMWLPVMDSGNKAMKSHPYSIRTRSGEIAVKAATMFDINKTIMRCLVKCLAMFGLGLYIYSGEDLPELPTEAPPLTRDELLTNLRSMAEMKGYDEKDLCSHGNGDVESFDEMTEEQMKSCIEWLRGR